MVVVEVVFGAAAGFVVGLLGGGGAVLTVPFLVYVLGVPPAEATTVSLVVVAVASAVGVVGHGRARRVAWRPGVVVGALGSAGAVLGSRLALLVEPRLLLSAFGLLLLAAGVAMARRPRSPETAEGTTADSGRAAWATSLVGLTTLAVVALGLGFVVGFLGVGGGFLVVPALVLLLRLPMPIAVGTSLLVIGVNSVVALAARYGSDLDVPLAAPVAGRAALGSVAGVLVSGRLSAGALRRAFGVLVVVVGAFILVDAVLQWR